MALRDPRLSRALEGAWLRLFARSPSAVAAKTALALLHPAGAACRTFAQARALLLPYGAACRTLAEEGGEAGQNPGGTCVSWGWGEPAALKAGKQSTEERALEEQLSTLLLTHHSAVVQLLLELCSDSFSLPDAAAGAQVRAVVCQVVHQTFLVNPVVVKLVHVQRYDPRLIPMLVREIPSMHACVPFLSELLAAPDQATRHFAVLLTGHVAHAYPLASTEASANLALQRLR
ncbi:integrator complex subunit 2-domain-containing protein, partial [Baffinella frigidus]